MRKTTEGVLESWLRCRLSVPLLNKLAALGRSRNVPMWTEPLMLLAWTLEYALPNATLDIAEAIACIGDGVSAVMVCSDGLRRSA